MEKVDWNKLLKNKYAWEIFGVIFLIAFGISIVESVIGFALALIGCYLGWQLHNVIEKKFNTNEDFIESLGLTGTIFDPNID